MRLRTRYALKLSSLTIFGVIVVSILFSIQNTRTISELQTLSDQVIDKILMDEVRLDAQALAELMASSLFEPVALDDFEQISNITNTTLQLSNVNAITVFDSEGSIINDGTDTIDPYGDKIPDYLQTKILDEAETIIEHQAEDIIVVTTPIVIGSNILGGLSIAFNISELLGQIAGINTELQSISERSAGQYFLWAIFLAIALSFISAFAGVWLSTNMTKPITTMSHLTQKISQGDYEVELPDMESDEMEELSKSFKMMTKALADSTISKEELEEIIQSRTNELHEANTKLKKLDEERRRFLTDISHELRTPLTALRGGAEVAIRKTNMSEESLRDALQRVVELSRQLARLVDDLLFIARSESGTLEFKLEPMPLIEPLSEACDDIKSITGRENISVSIDENIDSWTVNGDHQRLRQLFTVFLDNAVKYSEADKPIDVFLNSVKDRKLIQVMIRDNGIGISEEDKRQVFQRFQRGNIEKHVDGLGLGLAIAKAITDAHDAELQVESEPEVGTTVYINFKYL